MFGNMSNNIHTLSDMQQDSRQKCESKGNIHAKRISQSKRRKIERKPQDRIVTFNDLDIVRYNRQLLEAERKEKKGDIILNVMRKDGSQYFLYPYFNLSGSTVFINPKDPSKGLYEKNGKFYYGKTGGDTGNELKTFTKEKIEELKIKRIMGEKDFYKRINETELDKYFGKFSKPGYIVGSHFPTFESEGLMYDVIKEPMDSVRKKNNNINNYTLTYESTGIDSNNLENSGYSVINQNDTNFFGNSYEDYSWLNNYNNNNFNYYGWLGSEPGNYYISDTNQAPGIQYDHEDNNCSFSSKPDNNSYYTQTYTPQQISNNVNYHTNLKYPYTYHEENYYF